MTYNRLLSLWTHLVKWLGALGNSSSSSVRSWRSWRSSLYLTWGNMLLGRNGKNSRKPLSLVSVKVTLNTQIWETLEHLLTRGLRKIRHWGCLEDSRRRRRITSQRNGKESPPFSPMTTWTIDISMTESRWNSKISRQRSRRSMGLVYWESSDSLSLKFVRLGKEGVLPRNISLNSKGLEAMDHFSKLSRRSHLEGRT